VGKVLSLIREKLYFFKGIGGDTDLAEEKNWGIQTGEGLQGLGKKKKAAQEKTCASRPSLFQGGERVGHFPFPYGGGCCVGGLDEGSYRGEGDLFMEVLSVRNGKTLWEDVLERSNLDKDLPKGTLS